MNRDYEYEFSSRLQKIHPFKFPLFMELRKFTNIKNYVTNREFQTRIIVDFVRLARTCMNLREKGFSTAILCIKVMRVLGGI